MAKRSGYIKEVAYCLKGWGTLILKNTMTNVATVGCVKHYFDPGEDEETISYHDMYNSSRPNASGCPFFWDFFFIAPQQKHMIRVSCQRTTIQVENEALRLLPNIQEYKYVLQCSIGYCVTVTWCTSSQHGQ